MNGDSAHNSAGFALIIHARRNPDGTLADYVIHDEGQGIGQEEMLMLVRNWLRMTENKYHAGFSGQQS